MAKGEKEYQGYAEEAYEALESFGVVPEFPAFRWADCVESDSEMRDIVGKKQRDERHMGEMRMGKQKGQKQMDKGRMGEMHMGKKQGQKQMGKGRVGKMHRVDKQGEKQMDKEQMGKVHMGEKQCEKQEVEKHMGEKDEAMVMDKAMAEKYLQDFEALCVKAMGSSSSSGFDASFSALVEMAAVVNKGGAG